MAVARIMLTLGLLGLVTISVVVIKNISEAAWQHDQQQPQQGAFLRAPGCFPQQDPSRVDANLPPCQNVTFTVLAKPQTTTTGNGKYGTYTRTYRKLTLQAIGRPLQTVGDISEDEWNSLRVGDVVSTLVWRGQIQQVDANGHSSTILYDGAWRQAESRIWPWLVVALLCTAGLSLLWRVSRDGDGGSVF